MGLAFGFSLALAPCRGPARRPLALRVPVFGAGARSAAAACRGGGPSSATRPRGSSSILRRIVPEPARPPRFLPSRRGGLLLLPHAFGPPSRRPSADLPRPGPGEAERGGGPPAGGRTTGGRGWVGPDNSSRPATPRRIPPVRPPEPSPLPPAGAGLPGPSRCSPVPRCGSPVSGSHHDPATLDQ